MKSSEIMIPWNDWNRSMAINNVMEHLQWGETVPYVSGGNGGCGYGNLKLEPSKLDGYRARLNGCKYNNNPEVAADFNNFVNFEDYTDCVQFSFPDGGWMQFLLW